MEMFLDVAGMLLQIPSLFFRFAAIIVFLHCFYDCGFLWHRKKVLYFLPCLVLDCASLYLGIAGELLSLVAMVLEFVIILYDYTGKWYKGVWRFFLAFLLATFCETAVDTIMLQYLFPNLETYSAEMLFLITQSSNALYLAVYCPVFFYLYYRVYKRDIVMKCGKRERIFVWIFSVACFGVGGLFWESNRENSISLGVLGATFILATVLLPVFIYYLRISGHYQERAKRQELYMQAELEHFQQYKKTQEETARFRHDVRNNLLCLDQLLSQGKSREAEIYVKNLLEITETLRAKYVTGDEILDSILGVKSEMMTQKGTDFQLDGVLAGGLSWKSVDVCNVFANALDNAMEACEKLPENARYITMQIKATPQFWLVRIENPVKEKVNVGKLFQKEGSYTSKQQGFHGLGTYSMKHTVESYGGMVRAECTDRQFVLEIMIDKSRV